MPTIRINNTELGKIKLPAHGQQFYWDESLPGFGVKAMPSGLMFVVQRKIHGKAVRYILGRLGELSVKQAETLASEKLTDLRKGIDLNQAKKQAEHKGIILTKAFDEFMASRELRPRTAQTYNEIFNRCLKDWHLLALPNISRDMVLKYHKQITTGGKKKRGKSSANQAMRLLSAIFNYVIYSKNSDIKDNPVEVLGQLDKWNKLEARDTVIEETDLKQWYQSVMALGSDKLKDFFLFLMFSGLRRSECMQLQWSDIDIDKIKKLVIRPEISKTHKKRELPLTDELINILKRRKKERINWIHNPYVFVGAHGKGCLKEPKRAVNDAKAIVTKLRQEIDPEDESTIQWTSHDLRRSYATIAAKLDISTYKLKYLLGHSTSGDITSKHYAKLTVYDVREPAQKIADYLKKHLGIDSGKSKREEANA